MGSRLSCYVTQQRDVVDRGEEYQWARLSCYVTQQRDVVDRGEEYQWGLDYLAM